MSPIMQRPIEITPVSTVANHSAHLLFFLCALIACLSLGTSNPLLTGVGILIPPLLWSLLWRPGEPAVLFFGTMFQWLQAYTPVISANMEGKTMAQVFGGGELEAAAWLSMASVVALGFGMYVYQSLKRKRVSIAGIAAQSVNLSPRRLFVAYWIAMALSMLLVLASSSAGGLRQPLLAFANIKWVPVFLLAWTTMQNRKSPHFLFIVVAVELLLGFTGFFSKFTTILFVLIIVGLGTAVGPRRIKILPVLLPAAAYILLACFWQSIKLEYRMFLNQGTRSQEVLVPISERLRFVADAASHTSVEKLWMGAVSGVKRLGYIEYFAYCVKNVPSRISHQQGELWFGAVKHTVMPRLFFPDKKPINESERTRRFTLIGVAGAESGTSISLGYPAESYIDFGIPLMFVPIFLLGAFYAFVYQSLGTERYSLAGVALGTALLLFSALHLGASNISIVGGLTTGYLAFFLCARFAVPVVWPLLCE